jgi:hypothetical protein
LTILDKKLSTQDRFNRMSFTAHWKSRTTAVQKLVGYGVSMPKRLTEFSQKEAWITHYLYMYLSLA